MKLCVQVLGYAFEWKGCVFHASLLLPAGYNAEVMVGAGAPSWTTRRKRYIEYVRAMRQEPGFLMTVEPPCPLWLAYPGFSVARSKLLPSLSHCYSGVFVIAAEPAS